MTFLTAAAELFPEQQRRTGQTPVGQVMAADPWVVTPQPALCNQISAVQNRVGDTLNDVP